MKKCTKCNKKKTDGCFYKHPLTKDGLMAKCKECSKDYARNGNRTEKRMCRVCKKQFFINKTEVKRGGGIVCSRECYYKHMKATRPKEEDSWAWRGDKVGKSALHNWVEKHRGKPRKCEHCKTTKAKCFDWANISQEYKRDLDDWVRLCRKCHSAFDREYRFPKWKKSVEKLGWNVTKIK